MTSYHAMVKAGRATSGMKVGVIGFGGLGQVGTRAAVLAGAVVHVAEPKADVWELARGAGAVECVSDADAWAGQDLDLVVDYAGFDTTQKAINAIRRGGTVQVGLGKPTLTLLTHTILGKTVTGSLGGTVADIEEVYDLLVRHEIDPTYAEIGFDQIGAGLERLARNEVTGRLVARIDR